MATTHSLLLVITTIALTVVLPCLEAVEVDCEYGVDTACSCNATAEVCEFELTIEHLQTFTAYSFEANQRGQIFYINANGQLQPTRTNDRDLPCLDVNNCTKPFTVDGKTYRSFIGVNGQIPGPTLIVTEGQIVVVKVNNNLTSEATSIHWHGMHQRRTPWMDGVGQITQCPILPSTSFTYIFNATPSGTFWYHSHSGAQRTDGLFGGYIVRERDIESLNYTVEFEDVPEEHTVSLLDWQQEASLDLFTIIHSSLGFYPDIPTEQVPTNERNLYNSTRSVDGVEIGPVPYWSGIINGKGRHESVDWAMSNLQIFEVERNMSYRFRLIGAQSLYAYRFSIDDHKLIVIAVDGYFIQPQYNVDYIIIHSGERYDFVLEADQAPATENFWIRAETLESPSEGNMAEAILHYRGSPPPTPPEYSSISSDARTCSADSPCIAVNCPFKAYPDSDFISCININNLELFSPTRKSELPSGNPDNTLFFNFAFDAEDRTSSINARNFLFPPSPLTTQWKSFDFSKDFCPPVKDEKCIHVREIENDKTIRFVLSAIGRERSFSHPIHLHGHSFHVLYVGYGNYSDDGVLLGSSRDLMCMDNDSKTLDDEICANVSWRGGTPPFTFNITERTIRKDTVIVPAGGYVVIQFLSDNPGFWFLHCHIEVHQLEGMAMVIAEGREEQNSPPDGLQTCGDFTWTVEDFRRKVAAGQGLMANTLVVLVSVVFAYFYSF